MPTLISSASHFSRFPHLPDTTELAPPTTLLTHVRLPGYDQLMCLWVDPQEQIRSIQPMAQAFKQPPPERLRVMNLRGDWLSIGGIDLQINGALGLPFPELRDPQQDQKALEQICRFLWHQGVDGFLPTIVTSDIPSIKASLATIARYLDDPIPAKTAKILGVHLEGPCLHPQKRGAHPQQHLQPLTQAVMDDILDEHGSVVKIITLAPELDPTGHVIDYLRERGIIVSLGHSIATEAEAQLAFDHGATMVTHAFNAMPSLHHREAGLLGAALVNPQVYCGVIADGRHVNKTMLQLLLRAGQYSKQLFLVSDALAPLGLPEGDYPWDDRLITIQDGTAQLQDGTLAGTTLSLLKGVQNLVQWRLCSVDEAIAMATTTPLHALNDPQDVERRDRLYIGRSVQNLVHWHLDRDSHQISWERFSL